MSPSEEQELIESTTAEQNRNVKRQTGGRMSTNEIDSVEETSNEEESTEEEYRGRTTSTFQIDRSLHAKLRLAATLNRNKGVQPSSLTQIYHEALERWLTSQTRRESRRD